MHIKVSVPSSSGNSLQRSQYLLGYSLILSFSPLFIGELSSTENSTAFKLTINRFSPLFIGELSSTRYSSDTSTQRLCFSPLFIGELSSTAQVYLCSQRDTS